MSLFWPSFPKNNQTSKVSPLLGSLHSWRDAWAGERSGGRAAIFPRGNSWAAKPWVNSTRLFTNPLMASPLAFTAFATKRKALARKITPATQANFWECMCRRQGGQMVSALHSKSSCPGFSSGQGHHAVFLGKKMSKWFFFSTQV